MERVEKDMSFIIKAKKINFENKTRLDGKTIQSDENRILQVIEKRKMRERVQSVINQRRQ